MFPHDFPDSRIAAELARLRQLLTVVYRRREEAEAVVRLSRLAVERSRRLLATSDLSRPRTAPKTAPDEPR